MITKDDIKNLAHLARIDVPEAEMEKLASDMDGILAYVGEVSAAVGKGSAAEGVLVGFLKNVFRDDILAHEKGEYTKKILANAPAREGNYVKVKKIL